MKNLLLYGLVILINLLALELLLSWYFFQRNSPHPTAIVHYASYRLPALLGRTGQPTGPIGIWRDHELFGYEHSPNVTGAHRSSDFDVSYTIDASGGRIMPNAEVAGSPILFVGCSFTFGWGVEDDQAYPYLLATQFWPSRRIENRAVSGWGTAQVYSLILQEIDREIPPAAIVYGMIPDHIPRNYIRRSQVEAAAQSGRRLPHFELANGTPEFRGLADIESSMPGNGEVRETEIALTRAFLIEANRAARARGVPFIVVLLPQKFAIAWGGATDWPPAVIATLVEQDIAFIDLTELRDRVEFFDQDVHPNAAGHRTLADSLAASPLYEMIPAAR